MQHFTEEELTLLAIFEGPVRPLTREDQTEQEERDLIYKEKTLARHQGYAQTLGIPLERVQELAKENLLGLVERVALKKLRDPDGSKARHMRALLSAR